MTKLKFFAAAVLAGAGMLATGVAQARDDVQWSVTVGNAPVYGQPVYTQPVYTPVYRPAPNSRHWRGRDYRDDRIYQNGRVYYDDDHDGVPNGRDGFDNRVFQRNDVDGDGVPNWKDHHDARSQPVWWRAGYHPSGDDTARRPYRNRH
jgi:hypothetical protein